MYFIFTHESKYIFAILIIFFISFSLSHGTIYDKPPLVNMLLKFVKKGREIIIFHCFAGISS